MYQIAEWKQRYEVNNKGAPAQEGDNLRAGPLTFIRSAVHGRQMSTGFRRLQKFSGKSHLYRNFGIFQKFLEIAGDISRPLRDGTLFNEHDQPATEDDLAFMLDLTNHKEVLLSAIQALINAGWIVNSEKLQEFPKIPGKPNINPTQLNPTQDNINPPIIPPKKLHPSKEEFVKYITDNHLNIINPESLWQGYEDGEWIDTPGKPVTNWKLKCRTLHNFAKRKQQNGRTPEIRRHTESTERYR